MLEPRQTSATPPDALTAERNGSALAHTEARGSLKYTSPRDLDDLLEMDDLDDESLEAARKPRRWWIVAASGALVFAVIAGFLVVRSQNAKAPVTYQTQTIAQGNLTLTVSGAGPVQAALYNLNFTASGRIAQIDVQVGQTVKAGQTLAKLDTTSLQDSLNQAQLQANSAYYTRAAGHQQLQYRQEPAARLRGPGAEPIPPLAGHVWPRPRTKAGEKA